MGKKKRNNDWALVNRLYNALEVAHKVDCQCVTCQEKRKEAE